MPERISGKNFERIGFSEPFLSDIYYRVLKASWLGFLSFSVTTYLSINALFAAVYYNNGGLILNADPKSYWDAFIFSFQTSSTIGYGYLLPSTPLAHVIAIVDALSGILFVAIVTGLAFSKFSRPVSRVMFSDRAIIGTYDGEKMLIFRLCNGRSTHITEASIEVVALENHTTKEGHQLRKFTDLKLQRNRSPFFALTWTVFHKIDDSSPLRHFTEEDIKRNELSLVISFTGIDDVYAQTVHTNHMYQAKNIVFAKKFADMVEEVGSDTIRIDYGKLHEIEV